MKFFKCESCGNIVAKLNEVGCNPSCCGKPMKELVPGEVDAAVEKHVPAVSVEGSTVTVKVGEVEHPMTEAHFIEFIALETNEGISIKKLTPSDKPEAVFALANGETVKTAYAYCNLHGLWKKDI